MEALTCSCNTILSHSPVDPWHKFYTAAGIYTLSITICIAYSVLIMLITCLTLCCEKMVVFSSPLPTNAAYCVAEMYIQAALNSKIFPRCWLHSAHRKIYSSQLVSVCNKKVTRKKWACSCPNILSLLASKMINQLVWETKRERDFFCKACETVAYFF